MDSFDHLSVDTSDLVEALLQRTEECYCLLDLETGDVVFAGPEEVTGEPEDENWDDPDLFLPIPTIDSGEAFRIMEDFVDELPESAGQRSLIRALGHKKPFRSFKNALLEFPTLRERWFKFHDARMIEYAQRWLEAYAPGARLVQR